MSRRAVLATAALAAVALNSPTPVSAGPLLEPCGAPATIIGTPSNDHLTGTAGDDVIDGSGGDDTIDGRDGDDCVVGGPGRDVLHGGDGNDRLIGGGGRDVLLGGPGVNVLAGEDGADLLVGGVNYDYADGGPGADVIAGGRGADDLDGGPGADRVAGNGVHDPTLGDDFDHLVGGPGDDRLDGSPDGSANGGVGVDSCVGRSTPGCETPFTPVALVVWFDSVTPVGDPGAWLFRWSAKGAAGLRLAELPLAGGDRYRLLSATKASGGFVARLVPCATVEFGVTVTDGNGRQGSPPPVQVGCV